MSHPVRVAWWAVATGLAPEGCNRAEPGTRLCQNSLVSCPLALPPVQRRGLSGSAPWTAMGPIHGANRHAGLLCPERLDDDIAEAHPVRVLEAVVDALALAAWGLPPGRAGGDRAPWLCAWRALAALPLWRSRPPAVAPPPGTGGAAHGRMAGAVQAAPAGPPDEGARASEPSGAPAPRLPPLHAAGAATGPLWCGAGGQRWEQVPSGQRASAPLHPGPAHDTPRAARRPPGR
jgi:hypothetical protein